VKLRFPRFRFPRIPWRRLTTGRVLPWALAVVFLGTTLGNWWLLRSDRRDDARTATVTSTTRSFIQAFTNYRATTIASDVARIERYAVGSFAQQLKRTFDAAALRRIRTNKVVATGRIWNFALVSLSGSTAQIRALVYETVAKQGAAPTTDVFQMQIELLDTSDGWKADRVSANILGSSSGG
jgi:hypothetical protein